VSNAIQSIHIERRRRGKKKIKMEKIKNKINKNKNIYKIGKINKRK